jgi:hypothetical protein
MAFAFALLSGAFNSILWVDTKWEFGAPILAVVSREVASFGQVSESFRVNPQSFDAHGLNKGFTIYVGEALCHWVDNLGESLDSLIKIAVIKRPNSLNGLFLRQFHFVRYSKAVEYLLDALFKVQYSLYISNLCAGEQSKS